MLDFSRSVVCKEIVIDNLRDKVYHYEPIIKEVFLFDNSPIQTLKCLLTKTNHTSQCLFISAETYHHYEQHNQIFFSMLQIIERFAKR